MVILSSGDSHDDVVLVGRRGAWRDDPSVVPLSWNGVGLPVGMHFLGRFGDDATLLRLAGQREAARPRAYPRPPINAVGATAASAS